MKRSEITPSTAMLSDVFSNEDLISLHQAISKHLQALSFIRDNCIREQEQQQIVYALDFQELYAYSHPYDKDAIHSVMAAYILNNSTRPILLPVGTVAELLNYLDEVCRRLPGIRSLSTILRDQPKTADLVEKIGNLSKSDEAMSRYVDALLTPDTKELALTLVSNVTAYERGLDVLREVIDKENVHGISDLMDLKEISTADKEDYLDRYQRAYRLLDAERPDLRLNNSADAANIALTFLMRNYRSTKVDSGPYCVYLVTHTPTLMLINFKTWAKDLLGERYGLDYRILARPEDVLYATIVEENYKTWEARLAFADDATATCSRIHRRLVPSLSSPLRKGQQKITYLEDLRRLQTMKAQTLLYYLTDFFDYVDKELLAPLRTYEEQWALDNQFEMNKRLAFGQADALASHEIVVSSTDRIRSKISALERICKEKLLRDGRGLDEVVINQTEQSKPFAPGLFSLEEHEERDEELACTHYYLTRESRGVTDFVLGVDEYPEFYSCFWRTNMPFARLTSSLNNIWSHMLERGARQLEQKVQEGLDTRDIYVQGILAFTRKRRHELKLEMPLDIKKLIDPLAEEGLQSIRINTLVGDFFADVLPAKIGGDTYIGMVSHLNLEKAISDLFYETSRSYVWPTTLKSILHARLSKYELLQEDDDR